MSQMQCPACGKMYEPVLGERKHPEMLIQKEFPDATAEQREQLLTGICSNECWEALSRTGGIACTT
jgi:hypothetical protein